MTGEGAVRKVIASNMISLDGYYEGPGRQVMVLPFDGGFSAYNAARQRTADTLLLGPPSVEGFRDYRPPVAADLAASPVDREISQRNTAIGKVVISDSLTPEQITPCRNRPHRPARQDPRGD